MARRCEVSDPNHKGVEVKSMQTTGHTDQQNQGSTHHTTYGDGWHVSWNEDKSTGQISDVHSTIHDSPNPNNTINDDPDTINPTYEQ